MPSNTTALPQYRVEPTEPHCSACGHIHAYDIIDPGGDALGISFFVLEDAEEHALALNGAFALAMEYVARAVHAELKLRGGHNAAIESLCARINIGSITDAMRKSGDEQ